MRTTKWVVLVMMGWLACAAPLAAEPESLILDQLAHQYTTPDAIASSLATTFTFDSDETLFGETDHWQQPNAADKALPVPQGTVVFQISNYDLLRNRPISGNRNIQVVVGRGAASTCDGLVADLSSFAPAFAKSQVAAREVGDFMTVPRSRPSRREAGSVARTARLPHSCFQRRLQRRELPSMEGGRA